jgi:hypothetical protein
MNWNTIYITGKCGFEREVLYHLEHSNVEFMPGSASELDNFSLVWISDKINLKAFKKAISAKTILKYRLKFYSTLEELNQAGENKPAEKFTPQEENMIREMSDWQEEHPHRYKNSA